MTEKMIRIERTFKTGYIRPLGRGILLGDPHEYLDDIIEEAVGEENFSYSGGSTLWDIHIIIEIGEAEKR